MPFEDWNWFRLFGYLNFIHHCHYHSKYLETISTNTDCNHCYTATNTRAAFVYPVLRGDFLTILHPFREHYQLIPTGKMNQKHITNELRILNQRIENAIYRITLLQKFSSWSVIDLIDGISSCHIGQSLIKHFQVHTI